MKNRNKFVLKSARFFVLISCVLFLAMSLVACGSGGNDAEGEAPPPLIISKQDDGGNSMVGIVDGDMDGLEFSSGGKTEEFVDFPDSFSEGNVIAVNLNSQAKQNSSAKMFSVKQKKQISVRSKKKSKIKTSGYSLAKIKKMYYSGEHVKLSGIVFSENELNKLYYKALSLIALAKMYPKKKRKHIDSSKLFFDRIAKRTQDENLKAKALLWLSITELQYWDKRKTFSKRTFPLRYVVEEMPNSRVVNDAELYLSMFHKQNQNYAEAIQYLYRVKQSDPENLVYDFNLKKMVPPMIAAEHYLRQLETRSTEVFFNGSKFPNAGNQNNFSETVSNPSINSPTTSEENLRNNRNSPNSVVTTPVGNTSAASINERLKNFRSGDSNSDAGSVSPQPIELHPYTKPVTNGSNVNGANVQQNGIEAKGNASSRINVGEQTHFFAGDDEEVFFVEEKGDTNVSPKNNELPAVPHPLNVPPVTNVPQTTTSNNASKASVNVQSKDSGTRAVISPRTPTNKVAQNAKNKSIIPVSRKIEEVENVASAPQPISREKVASEEFVFE